MTNSSRLTHNKAARIGSIIAIIILITFLHYSTPTAKAYFHNVYQRLYYIPIILSCYWFGFFGGVGSALIITILYIPHVTIHWKHEETYQFNQIVEIVMFFTIGAIAGYLSDREKRQRERYIRTAEERDHAFKELQQTFERLRLLDRLSTLGKLSAGMAHEIKNPLAGIYGSMEILEKEFDEENPKYEFVQILKKEINRLTGIVNRYLELARPRKPEKSVSNLNDTVKSLIEICSRQAEKDGITIKSNLDPALPDTLLDEGQIRQAILNILINAMEETPGGKSIEVETGILEKKIFVSIRDQGKGISESDMGKLFDPFFTTKKEGTGLGLPIAFQIITNHGGEIRVKNDLSGGAIFTILLSMETPGGAS
ncbi:MAG: ATP-binding protein [Acidobacteriota bacterium]